MIARSLRVWLAPRWWLWHLALVAVLVAFTGLGLWQFRAYDRAAPPPRGPAVPLAQVADPGGRLSAAAADRYVVVRGTWQADGQLVVPDRERDGRAGAWVVTPLRTGDGLVTVVRGWVPRGEGPPPPVGGAVTVRGVLRPNETDSEATGVVGALPRGQVPYVSAVTVLSALPYDHTRLYDGYLLLGDQQPHDAAAPAPLPAPPRAAGPERWRNLAYAVQWWLFAAAAVYFWGSVIRQSEQRRTAAPAPAG